MNLTPVCRWKIIGTKQDGALQHFNLVTTREFDGWARSFIDFYSQFADPKISHLNLYAQFADETLGGGREIFDLSQDVTGRLDSSVVKTTPFV